MNINNIEQIFGVLNNNSSLVSDESELEMLKLFRKLPESIKIHQIIRIDGFIEASQVRVVTHR